MKEFDDIIERRNTDSFKWDMIIKLYGEDVLPMWVADMDFKSPQRVIDALKNRVEHGVFGYTFRSHEYYNAIVEWYRKIMDLKSKGNGLSTVLALFQCLHS
jgi:cystathionine beta-lyase